ncbi:MAG: ABC transporter permease, partial [Acidimicrobiia bacterium]|nr:ABC transporter permease [Acidimicrobiia bacterium]
ATTIYLRTEPDQVAAVDAILPFTVNPQQPEGVRVSRPSDVLIARAAARGAYSALVLGLGALAVVVGGVGIANVMVIAVLERRSEIGLRRALGATTQHIRVQFLAESLVLSTLGGLAGTAVGVAVTAAYANVQGWAIVVPGLAVAGGLGAAVALGAAAGIYPAVRAARLTPTDALRA